MRRLLMPVAALLLALPCYGQQSDSSQIKLTKQTQDSMALLIAPAIAKQCSFSVQGFFKPACQFYAPLALRERRSNDSALVLSRLMRPTRVDTVTIRKTDTVTKIVHDTVYAPAPTPTPTPTPVPVDTTKPPVDTVKVPPPPIDTSLRGQVLALVGPTIPLSSEPSSIAFYEQKFKAYADTQWAQFGAAWDAGNTISEYERGATYYKQWALTGDTVWFNRAHALVVNWRDNYLIPAGYGTSPHFSQQESLYLDCTIAKDQKSCDAIPAVAYKLSGFPDNSYWGVDHPNTDARLMARVIIALWMNEKAGNPQYSTLLDSAIVRALRLTNADGYIPFVSTCGGSLNYMNGMFYDALTRIHDQRPKAIYNAQIEAKATAYAAWAWSTQWRSDGSFNYVSVQCDGTGSASASPDLNGLMVPVFGWVGKLTGDATWFTKGDQIMQGMQQASFYLYRQFSESFSSSYRYLGYRYGSK